MWSRTLLSTLHTTSTSIETKFKIPAQCDLKTDKHLPKKKFQSYNVKFHLYILVYVEMGSQATNTAGLEFTFDSTITTVSRAYEIKVSQIQCSNLNR